jgi:hypothetical protein
VGVGLPVVGLGEGVRVGEGDGETVCVGATVGTAVAVGAGAGAAGAAGATKRCVGGGVAGAAGGGACTIVSAMGAPEVGFTNSLAFGMAVFNAGEILGAVT